MDSWNWKQATTGLNKLTTSLLSIFLVFFSVWLFLLANDKYDGSELFKVFFYDSFTNPDRLKDVFLFFAPFLLGSLAVFISFRSGLINLGAAGQMSIAALSIYVVNYFLKKQDFFINADQKLWIPIFFLIGIFSAVILSLFCGVLKVYFQINEVLSTIFLNFIIFYVYRYFVGLEDVVNSTKTATNIPVGDGIAFNITFGLFSLTFILAFVIFFITFLFIKRSRFGFQTYIVGKNKGVARYAGINFKTTTLWVFFISGVLTGLAGIFYYYRDLENTNLSKSEAVNAYAFDTITITWLSQSSFFGLPFAAFFIALIRAQQRMIKMSSINPVIVELIIGLLLLFMTFFSQLISDQKTRERVKQLFYKPYFFFFASKENKFQGFQRDDSNLDKHSKKMVKNLVNSNLQDKNEKYIQKNKGGN